MISRTDRIYYIDPIQDPTDSNTARILVLDEKREGHGLVNTVVKIKTRATIEGGRVWFSTEQGYHVRGAILNPIRLQNTTNVMALLGGDVFAVGVGGGQDSGNRLLRDFRRSDGKVIPAHNDDGSKRNVMMTKEWLQAAPWAYELMPVEGDSAEMVSAKVAVAKQKWEERRAMGVILMEGAVRDWLHHLDEIREDHNIPTPVFGGMVEGEVGMPSNVPVPRADDRTVRQAATLATLTDKLGATDPSSLTLMVPFSTLLPLNASTREAVMATAPATIIEHVRNKADDWSLTMGQYSLTPVLRSAS